jgi:hypothetical protein
MIRLERGLWAQSPTVVCVSLLISKFLLETMGQLRHDAELFAQRTTWPNNTAWQIGGPADRRSRRRWNGLSSSSVPVRSNNIGVRRGRTMEKTLSGVVIVSIVAIALPAWSQFSTTQGPIAPAKCAGHPAPFQVRRAGLPGSKSGPTVTRYGTTALEGCTEAAKWRSEQGYRASRQQSRPDRQAYGHRQISRTRGQGVGKPRSTSHLGPSMTLFQRG